MYREHALEAFELRSQLVGPGQLFRIQVHQPISRADGSERFPVLYAPDANHLFGGLSDLATLLQIMGDTQRFILVGIGYDDAPTSRLLRWRDFLPAEIRGHFRDMLPQLARSALTQGAREVDLGKSDADHYLEFLRAELMPVINGRYPTLAGDSHYFGYSLGGTFGLYTLFTQPDTFRRYLIGSPATSYRGQAFVIELAKGFIASGARLTAELFLAVGELEEFDTAHAPFDLVTGYYQLAKFLQASAIPGLELTCRAFARETHATTWTRAFACGMKALFPPTKGQPPPWLKFLS
jgi:uncharacterized protein